MGPEANINSIRALEKQIVEGEGDVIKLKRSRNLLLNISTRVPPEILGHIFCRNIVRETDYSLNSPSLFAGLQKGSYNFLLVCHHWFEVASRTPALWSFWGTTFQQWKKRHHRSAAIPLDLVLEGSRADPGVPFDESLQVAVRGRAMQDTIRRVHLLSYHPGILTSIISLLTPNDEGGRNENIESIVWYNVTRSYVDASNFFARSRLSRLRFIKLCGTIQVSSLDRLALQTRLLTTLSLTLEGSIAAPTLTAPQLFSILTSNPDLRELCLSGTALPDDADGSTFKVPLHNLKMLFLRGDLRRVLGLLRHLILPDTLDEIILDLFNLMAGDIPQILGPYIRDYFQRNPRYQDRLEIDSHSSLGQASISVVNNGSKFPYVTLVIEGPPLVMKKSLTKLIAFTPVEYVRSFHVGMATNLPEKIFSMMPNIEMLHLRCVQLSEGFLQPNPNGSRANTKLLPSLRLLRLEDVKFQNDEDWDHLAKYLDHQTSDEQPISLEVIGRFPYTPPDVVDRIKDLVKEFTYRRNAQAEEDE